MGGKLERVGEDRCTVHDARRESYALYWLAHSLGARHGTSVWVPLSSRPFLDPFLLPSFDENKGGLKSRPAG